MLLLDDEVKEGRIAGAVFGIVRHGKLVWLRATGFRDKAANLPMTTDALFPLASHGGPLWEPMCYAQIGGLSLSTLITLVLVPVVSQ